MQIFFLEINQSETRLSCGGHVCDGSIVTKLLDSFKKEINEKISEKSNKQIKAIENLTKENEELREQIAGQRKKMSEIQKQVA